MEEVTTSFKGEYNDACERWRSLNFHFISSRALTVYSAAGKYAKPPTSGRMDLHFPSLELKSISSLQVSGTAGHQPGLQLPLQLCDALAGHSPGHHQHLPHHCSGASHCLPAQSDTSSERRLSHILRGAGSSTHSTHTRRCRRSLEVKSRRFKSWGRIKKASEPECRHSFCTDSATLEGRASNCSLSNTSVHSVIVKPSGNCTAL